MPAAILSALATPLKTASLTWRMFRSVSPTARYGGLTRGACIADSHVQDGMRRILAEIRSGSFARELMSAGEEPSPSPWPPLSETYLRLKSAFGA
jgi:ketol-acid reductoisomerase